MAERERLINPAIVRITVSGNYCYSYTTYLSSPGPIRMNYVKEVYEVAKVSTNYPVAIAEKMDNLARVIK